jgi:hypothetical protein
MQIEKHDKSYIVKLEDGSSWRIWPGDIALTLGWSSITVLEVSEIDDEFCSHALIHASHHLRFFFKKPKAIFGMVERSRSLRPGMSALGQ